MWRLIKMIFGYFSSMGFVGEQKLVFVKLKYYA